MTDDQTQPQREMSYTNWKLKGLGFHLGFSFIFWYKFFCIPCS